MKTLSLRGRRMWLAVALGLGAAVTAPMACFFPGYTFESSTTGTGGATSSGTMTATSSTTTSTTTGMGGTAATTSSSTTSGGGATTTGTTSTSSSGTPCASQNCSDPTCKDSFECVPVVSSLPTGWTGYFALYDGAPAGVPGCGGMWPTSGYEGNAQVMFTAATCTGTTTCSVPSGGTCQIPELVISDAACNATGVCSGPITPPAGYTAGTCFNFPDPTSGFDEFGGSTCGPQQAGAMVCDTGTKPCNVSAAVAAGTVDGSACTPDTSTPTLEPPTWASAGQACGGTPMGTGCSSSSDTCMEIPQGPFVPGVCVMQSGNQSCPPDGLAQFADQYIFFSGKDDTRGCAAGTCGAPTGDSCTVTWDLYSDANSPPSCQTQVFTMSSDQCVAISGNPNITSAKAKITVPPNGGLCTPIDGQPTGTVTPTGATTFCCVPAPT